MEWEPYLNERLIKRYDGYYIIKPVGADPAVPLSCEICDRLYRHKEDEQAHLEFGCCHACALQWAHANKQKWAKGWRPPPAEVASNVEKRPNIVVTIDID